VTNLVEIIRLDNKTAAHAGQQFNNAWLSRYPLPSHCIYDQGTEFVGYAFQQVLANHGIQRHPTTVKNPQANAICERMHQAVGNSLRTLTSLKPPDGLVEARQVLDTALANAMYAHRATLTKALESSPGALAFNRDMVLDIPFVADYNLIRDRRQQIVDRNLLAANRKRISYDYHIGDQVLRRIHDPASLEPRFEGPYEIATVHTNGTITIRLNATTLERISIRRVKPFRA